jgi:hypothetical protein
MHGNAIPAGDGKGQAQRGLVLPAKILQPFPDPGLLALDRQRPKGRRFRWTVQPQQDAAAGVGVNKTLVPENPYRQ